MGPLICVSQKRPEKLKRDLMLTFAYLSGLMENHGWTEQRVAHLLGVLQVERGVSVSLSVSWACCR